MHALVDTAEICTKFFSMKWRFNQYIISLLSIAAYWSMELFLFPKMPKVCNLQPYANKHTYLAKTLEYEDDKSIFEFLEL